MQGWISHGLVTEYYDEGAFIRNPEANLLPSMASGKNKRKIILSDTDKIHMYQYVVYKYISLLLLQAYQVFCLHYQLTEQN